MVRHPRRQGPVDESIGERPGQRVEDDLLANRSGHEPHAELEFTHALGRVERMKTEEDPPHTVTCEHLAAGGIEQRVVDVHLQVPAAGLRAGDDAGLLHACGEERCSQLAFHDRCPGFEPRQILG